MFAAPILASAQTPQAPPPTVFTFAQAVRYALDRCPTVRAALEQINAATAGVTVALKGAIIPMRRFVAASAR